MKRHPSLLEAPLDARLATMRSRRTWDLREMSGRHRVTAYGSVAVSVTVVAHRIDPAPRRFPPEVRVQVDGAELAFVVNPRWYGSAGCLIAVLEAELPRGTQPVASVQVDDVTESLALPLAP